jgi:hypothetical protein
MASADMSDVKNAVELASSTVADESDASAGIATASSDSASKDTGMGGPLEEAQGYPACEPGRGDDHCIQLYERGVAQSLAAWKGSEPAVAVGGPFEPSADGAKDQPAPETDHATMDHSTMDHGAMTTDTATADKPAATAETDATAAATAKPAPMESDAADSSAETVTEK